MTSYNNYSLEIVKSLDFPTKLSAGKIIYSGFINIIELFYFFFVELFEAVNRYDNTETEQVCKKSEGNLNFIKSLVFVVENELMDSFNILWRYGARFIICGDIAIKLILTALTKQNIVLCEKLLSVGITKNSTPTASLSSDIPERFSRDIIAEYNIFREHFADTKFEWNLEEKPLIHHVINESKDLRVFEILMKHRFNVNSRDNLGNFPIHEAARVGHSFIMKTLIKNNAKINATNHANQSPLHLAAKNGHKKVFDILKSFDANDFRDNVGKTAEEYARKDGHYDNLYVEYLPLYS